MAKRNNSIPIITPGDLASDISLVNGACGHCKNTDVKKLFRGDQPDMVCTLCGAVYYNPDHSDVKLAGKFTGKYEEVAMETVYKVSSDNRKKDAKGK